MRSLTLSAALCLLAVHALAEPFAPPGDTRLRFDLAFLNDTGYLDIPLSTWPVSWADIGEALERLDDEAMPLAARDAYLRVQGAYRDASAPGMHRRSATVSAASRPRFIRTFEDTPRENAEVGIALGWQGNRIAYQAEATVAASPGDDDYLRPDGSYLVTAAGNWMLSAGWQARWWGPGRDGSLILSSNARPAPGIAVQRNASSAFESKWLSWIGPWSLTVFMNRLDDERVVDDALLFGLRVTFRPHDSLEIGLSRTAQWCGNNRSCSFGTFTDLLLGKDNRGVNVDPEDEPGNQLAGIDLRWRLPRGVPLALYMQWIGEDTRQGGPEIGSWLRQAGIEHWGQIGGLGHRTHLEISDTTCREGGFGFSDLKPNCAYDHGIYQTGYRYKGRSIGFGTDGDGRTYSLGSTLVQSAGHGWNLTLRYMELNRAGAPSTRHTLTATPQELADIQLSHDRVTRFGRFHAGLGLSRLDDELSGDSSTDLSAFVRWVME